MSAPLAGKFQDPYEVLGIDPRSTNEVVKDTYQRLLQKAREAENPELIDSLKQAYEVLNDPQLRRELDKIKGVSEDKGGPKFSGVSFFESFRRDARLRLAILCMLYDRRRSKPFTPSLSVRVIEGMLLATQEEITLSLWYLKQQSLAANDDKSSVLITVEGIDFLEQQTLNPSDVLPLFKPTALKGAADAAPEPAAVVATPELVEGEPLEPEPEPVLAGASASGANSAGSLAILRRVLSRT